MLLRLKQERGNPVSCVSDCLDTAGTPIILTPHSVANVSHYVNVKLSSFFLIMFHIKPKKPAPSSLYTTLHPRETSL